MKVFYYNTFLARHLGEGMVSRRFFAAAQKLEGWELRPVPAFSLAEWQPRTGNGRVDSDGQAAAVISTSRQQIKKLMPSDVRQAIRSLQSPRSRVPIAPYLNTRRRKQMISDALQEEAYDLFWLHLSQEDLAPLAWLVRYLKAERPHTPVVLRAPGPLAYQADHVFHRYMSQADRRHEQYLYQAADIIMVISADMKQLMVEQGAASEKLQVLPNGIDFDSFVPARADGRSVRQRLNLMDVPVVGYVGGFWHGNDMDTLMKAWQTVETAVPEATLLLVGDGPQREIAQAFGEALGLQRVTWVGEVPHAEVPNYLAAMDIGVGPYIEEALNFVSPLKVIEYTAMGLPVIAAHGGQIKELVLHGTTGYTYPAEDAEALAQYIIDLLNAPEKAQQMGQRAQEHMRTWHSWDEMAQRALSTCHVMMETYEPT